MLNSLVGRICLGLAIVSCLLLTGCSSRVNKANYDKINTGMTVAEVEGILGKGEEQASTGLNIPAVNVEIPGGPKIDIPGGGNMSAKVIKWQDGDKTIVVTFMGDKVAAKANTKL